METCCWWCKTPAIQRQISCCSEAAIRRYRAHCRISPVLRSRRKSKSYWCAHIFLLVEYLPRSRGRLRSIAILLLIAASFFAKLSFRISFSSVAPWNVIATALHRGLEAYLL